MSDIETNRIIEGDAFDALAELPDASVHTVVCDPPYGLNFMPNVTNGWDDFEPTEYQQWCEQWTTAAKRVLKPGGHLLAFSGNRTHHRLFAGVEDAGYEIRDTLTWHYGEGFPKALDVGKAIDDAEGAEREAVGEHPSPLATDGNTYGEYTNDDTPEITAPATDAEQWDGFKTTLKPATEFIVLARKPFDGTVAGNVLKHGTAALNIGECRIGNELREFRPTSQRGGHVGGDNSRKQQQQQGRYPANLALSHSTGCDENGCAENCAVRMFDEQSGVSSSSVRRGEDGGFGRGNVYGDDDHEGLNPNRGFDDEGGASRFYYTSKATSAERTLSGRIDNAHPTVKPLDLMEWLVKLATVEGQIVLDPFAGTGTTCRAAKDTGREFVGIEQQAKWCDVARARCGLTPDDPSVLSGDEQNHLGEFCDGGGQ